MKTRKAKGVNNARRVAHALLSMHKRGLIDPEEPEPPNEKAYDCTLPPNRFAYNQRLLREATKIIPWAELSTYMDEHLVSFDEWKRWSGKVRDKRLQRNRERHRRNYEKEKTLPPPQTKHPAIVAFVSVCHFYPQRQLRQDIINLLGDNPDVEFMRLCFVEWVKKGWKPTNLAWLFEWYHSGRIPQGSAAFTKLVRPPDIGANPPPDSRPEFQFCSDECKQTFLAGKFSCPECERRLTAHLKAG